MERRKGIPLVALVIFAALLVAIIITCVIILNVNKPKNSGGEPAVAEQIEQNPEEKPQENENGEEINNEDVINQDADVQQAYALTGNGKTFAKYGIYSSGGFSSENDNIKNEMKLQLAVAQVTNSDMEGASAKTIAKSKIQEYVEKIFEKSEAEKTEYSDFSLYDSDTNFTDVYKTTGYVYNSDNDNYSIRENDVTEETPSEITEVITKAIKYDSKLEIYVKPLYIRTFYSSQIQATGCDILADYDFQAKNFPDSESLIAISYSDYEQYLKSDYAKDLDGYKYSEVAKNLDLNKVKEYKYTFVKEDNKYKLKSFEQANQSSNSGSSESSNTGEMSASERTTFNAQFEQYVGNDIKGSEVRALYDIIIASNSNSANANNLIRVSLDGSDASTQTSQISDQRSRINNNSTYSVQPKYAAKLITDITITEN